MSTLWSSARSVRVPPPERPQRGGVGFLRDVEPEIELQPHGRAEVDVRGLTLDQHRVFARVACAAVGRHEHLVARVEERGGAGGVRHRNAEPHELALGGPVGVAADHRGHPGRQAHELELRVAGHRRRHVQRCLAVAHRPGRQVVGRGPGGRGRRARREQHDERRQQEAGHRPRSGWAAGGCHVATLPEAEVAGLRRERREPRKAGQCRQGLRQQKIAVPGMSPPRSGLTTGPRPARWPSGHSGSTRSTSTSPAATSSRTRSPSVRWCST